MVLSFVLLTSFALTLMIPRTPADAISSRGDSNLGSVQSEFLRFATYSSLDRIPHELGRSCILSRHRSLRSASCRLATMYRGVSGYEAGGRISVCRFRISRIRSCLITVNTCSDASDRKDDGEIDLVRALRSTSEGTGDKRRSEIKRL